jgi:hypothetical protein
MFFVPSVLRGLMSERDQLRLLTKIDEEPDDEKAYGLFMNGDGTISGFKGWYGFGYATATMAAAKSAENEPTQAPSPGTVAKPAFDLGMLYAEAGREPLTDASIIARYAIVHSGTIAEDVAIPVVSQEAAAAMFLRGYTVGRDSDALPHIVEGSRKYLSNLDRAMAKREGRNPGLFGRLFSRG